MKTKEELNAMKAEAETLGAKLAELNEDELAEVTGGVVKPSLTLLPILGIMVTGFVGLPTGQLPSNEYSSLFDGCPDMPGTPGLPATEAGGANDF